MKSIQLAITCVPVLLLLSCALCPPLPVETAPEASKALAKTPVEAPAKPDESWRATAPVPGPAPSPVIPTFTRTTMANGLSIIVSERPGLPLVSISFAVQAGSSIERKQQAGLADLTYETMLEGAGTRDGIALAEAFADLGTSFGVSTERDGAAFGLTVLKRNLDPALTLVADVVRKPTLKAKDFKRKQKERLADITRMMANPRYLSNAGISSEVYGVDHPYGHPVLGTEKTVAKLKPADVKRFYRQQVAPSVSALIFTGDVTLAEARALADKHFGKWKVRPPKAKAAPPAVGVAPRKRIAVIPQKGLKQTIISMGRPAVEAGNEQEWALTIATDVFGGMFGSRLNMNLREDKGYTYGARARLAAMRQMGGLIAFSSVQADVTGAALTEFFKELGGMTEAPISQEEFENARDNVLRSVSGWFESIGGLSRAATRIFLRNLPLDRYQRMIDGYRQLTLEAVQLAAKQYFEAPNMKLVLVGDMDVIKKQVPAINVGELEEISVDTQ